jgi:hypothetical protein
MKKFSLLAILFFLQTFSFGQNNDLPNREAFNLTLMINDTNAYFSEIQSSPYILPDNSIQIYPGEKIFVEIELVKNEIKSMKTVKENLHPEKTLIISFSEQTHDNNIYSSVILKIVNPFNKQLEYKASIFLEEQRKWVSTSVLPVKAKLSAYETWSDLIVTISLSDLKFK